MDESRTQFEAWLRAQPHVLNVGIESDGTYTLHEDRVAWEAWQASREAVEVELPTAEPDRGSDSQVDISAGFSNRMRSKCIESIRAAGIKVKGE